MCYAVGRDRVIQLPHPTVEISPVEKVMSAVASYRAFLRAVARQRWFRSKDPVP